MIRKNDYEVMEVLVNGEWIEADVLKTLEDGTCLYLMGNKTAEGGYLQGGAIPADVYRPLKKFETRVKSRMDIIKTLIADGYAVDNGGNWTSGLKSSSFRQDMFNYCGDQPLKHYTWEENWLEEVEITEE